MPPLRINQFPPEILAQILGRPELEHQKSNYGSMLQLACVCRHWHDVLFTHPQFWTTMECIISTKFQDEPDPVVRRLIAHLKRWFGRAGNLPLNLSLLFNVAAGKIAALYDYLISVSQWRSLAFTLDMTGGSNWRWLEGLITTAQGRGQTCWPLLETLEIEAPVRYTTGRFTLPLDVVAPNIRHFRASIDELQFTISPVFQRFPWTHITYFEFSGTIGGSSLPFYLHVLSRAPNLVSLKALDWPTDLTSPIDPPTIPLPVSHQGLQHLSLNHSPGASELLGSIRLPSLRVLEFLRPSPTHLPDDNPNLSHTVRRLLSTSRCEIKVLRLKWAPLSEQDLVNVLTVVGPSVEYVDLDEAASATSPAPFFALLQDNNDPSWQEMLPRLKRFSYNLGYRCSVVRKGEEEFDVFRSTPLAWWKNTEAGRRSSEE